MRWNYKSKQLPFSLKFEGLQALGRLLPEGPEVQLVVGRDRDEGPLVDQELGVEHRLADVVTHVRVDPRPAQSVSRGSGNAWHIFDKYSFTDVYVPMK